MGAATCISLGAVLYEAATGTPPFAEGSVGATLNAVVNDDTVTLSGAAVELSGEFAQIVDRLLAKEPSGRFASAAHLVEALERASGTRPERVESSPSSADGFGSAAGTDTDARADTSPSIAVLPFVNFSADPESDFFSDGLAEELTTGLSRVKGLRVAARSSAFRFKDRDVDAREAGRDLGVSSILEGSVRRAGDRVRITVQLVEVATGYQIWSERYDGTLEDIFQIQEDTASAIVEQLQVRLGASGPTTVLRRHTTDPEAYEMYLRGRFHLERRHRGEQLRALACFRSAIAIDPDYALAHVGVADVHWTAVAYGGVLEDESRAASLAALDRALQLDPDLPEAHASKAVLATMECDWDRAEELYERALELDPNYWLTHAYRAMQAGVCLQGDVVDHHVARVLELEPESAYAVGICGLAQYFAQNYAVAIELGQRALVIDPALVMAHMALGWAYSDTGDHERAIVHAEQGLQTAQRAPIFLAMLASICGLGGDRERSERLFDELCRRAENERVNPLFLGMACLGTGDREAAHRYYLDAMGSDRPPAWGPCMARRPFPDVLEILGLPVPEGHQQAES